MAARLDADVIPFVTGMMQTRNKDAVQGFSEWSRTKVFFDVYVDREVAAVVDRLPDSSERPQT